MTSLLGVWCLNLPDTKCVVESLTLGLKRWLYKTVYVASGEIYINDIAKQREIHYEFARSKSLRYLAKRVEFERTNAHRHARVQRSLRRNKLVDMLRCWSEEPPSRYSTQRWVGEQEVACA